MADERMPIESRDERTKEEHVGEPAQGRHPAGTAAATAAGAVIGGAAGVVGGPAGVAAGAAGGAVVGGIVGGVASEGIDSKNQPGKDTPAHDAGNQPQDRSGDA
jgi:hypothetical protein